MCFSLCSLVLCLFLLLLAGCTTATPEPTATPTAAPTPTPAPLVSPGDTTYYVDCAGGDDGNDGAAEATPWRTLAKVNESTFAPGDAILFKRGATCSGALWPQGSGADGAPVAIGAYGAGSLPVIDGGENEATVKLYDQEYWHVRDLEVAGGTKFGVLVAGSDTAGVLGHFRLTDLVVHDVWGAPLDGKTSGLVVFLTGGGNNVFHDVVVDGVTAYNTNQWAGIEIAGGPWPIDAADPVASTDVLFRNATVYNVYGDGIVQWTVENGLIEHCVAYDTGQQPPPQTVGTPSAIWTWGCFDCTVQFNEAYRSDSPERDGGCYDIDWVTARNTYQYNYGHDSQGYCQAVFGASGYTTTDAVVRYNICANNGQDVLLAKAQGDFFLSTWEGGYLDGVCIYNNTVYWNPASNGAPALINRASFTGSAANFFENNIIYSTAQWLVESNAGLELDYNIYWYTGTEVALWLYERKIYRGFTEYQQGSGQDGHGLYADPLLNDPTYHEVGRPTTAFTLQDGSPAVDAGADLGDMGARDFFGNPIPRGAGYDIGAHEW
jgi:hypothetical protein